ncbi:MAG: dihydropyrimidinase [Oscillospiraceae bacterium]|nr:dihydropyrimidinase [Oscillospiraceae bacterium]
MDLIVKNGKIVSPVEVYEADVAVKDGIIAAIGKGFDETGAQVVDALGKYVLPGAIDVHTHLAMPFGGTVSADGYFSGTRAAACGGVTTVFDYAIQRKGKGIVQTVEERNKMAENEACVDYAFHCAVTDLNGGELLDEFSAAAEYGVPSFKCFMVYKKENMMVDDGTLAKILEKSKEAGTLTNVHAENPDLIDARISKYLSEGKTSAWYHYMSRPEFVEAEADIRAIHWAKSLNAPLYIVHLANKEGAEAVSKARSEGYEIYAETCPQYLYFTNEVYKRDDGRNFVCSPPMKGEESRKALWKALKRGDISVVATDHCPFMSYEKDWGKDDFTKIPNGCAGVENLYPFMLDAANKGEISFSKAVEVCSFNPAKIFGCAKKGNLTPGYDADIVIYDPKKEFTVSCSNMHSDYDHTIWEGVKFSGYPEKTFSRGKLVYDNGKFVGEAGWGKFVKRIPRK